jgi:hypothetical protein
MGLADWFKTFCANIQVQDGGTISTRYKAITRRLNTDFWDTTLTRHTVSTLAHTAYGRNTATQGFSDLDIVFELPSTLYFQYDKHAGNGQSALLHDLGELAQKHKQAANDLWIIREKYLSLLVDLEIRETARSIAAASR